MKIFRLLLVIALLAPLTITAQTPQVGVPNKIKWTPPSLYMDGSTLPISDLTEYRYWCNGNLTLTIPNEPEGISETDLSPTMFPTGTYECFLTAVTRNGNESHPSNSVFFTVDPRVPGPPENLSVEFAFTSPGS